MSSLPCRAQTLHLPLCARAEADEGRRNPGEILAPGSRVPGFPSQPISSTIARLSEPRGGAANSGSTGVRENRRERLQGGAAAISPAKPPSPKSSSQRTRHWREPDSNHRSRSCERLFWALAIGDGWTKGGSTPRRRCLRGVAPHGLSLAGGP